MGVVLIGKKDMFYDPGRKFTMEDSETSPLSIHFHFNTLQSFLIKKDSFSKAKTFNPGFFPHFAILVPIYIILSFFPAFLESIPRKI